MEVGMVDENDPQIDLIQEVEEEYKIAYVDTKYQRLLKSENSQEYFSTPSDLSRKQENFKINISRIDNHKRSSEDNKDSPSSSIIQMLDKTSLESNGLSKFSLSSNQFQPVDSVISEICGYHQKPLDVVCIRDMTLICSSCALFGVHKGHDFKSLAQVNRDKNKFQKSIQKIVEKKQQIQDFVRNTHDGDEDLLMVEERKAELIMRAKAEYRKLRELLDSSEEQLLQIIEQEAILTQQRIRTQNKLLLKPFTSYYTWQHKARRYLDCLQSQDRFEQQIVMLNYDKNSKTDILAEGEQVLSQINKNISNVRDIKNDAIEQFQISIDNTLPQKIKGFISIPSYKSISNKIIKSSNNLNILTDSKKQLNTRRSIQLDEADTQKITLTVTSPRSRNPYGSTNSTLIPRKQSFSKLDRSYEKRSVLRSPQFSPNSSAQRLESKDKKFRQTNQKYNQKFSKVYDLVLNDSIQIVDLMHVQLPNQAIIQILRLLPDRPKIKTLKLNGNRLTDDIASQLWNSLRYVTSLNLSGNLLSDGFVASMSTNIYRARCLRTIVLSQNKINSRNVKPLIQQIRKIGITVSI